MSADVKAFGRLTFDAEDDIDDARATLEDDDDDSVTEARGVADEGTIRSGLILNFAIDANLSAEANVWLQAWLSDLAEVAIEGHIDTWQDALGDGMFVRVHAGGRDERIDAPFPHP